MMIKSKFCYQQYKDIKYLFINLKKIVKCVEIMTIWLV